MHPKRAGSWMPTYCTCAFIVSFVPYSLCHITFQKKREREKVLGLFSSTFLSTQRCFHQGFFSSFQIQVLLLIFFVKKRGIIDWTFVTNFQNYAFTDNLVDNLFTVLQSHHCSLSFLIPPFFYPVFTKTFLLNFLFLHGIFSLCVYLWCFFSSLLLYVLYINYVCLFKYPFSGEFLEVSYVLENLPTPLLSVCICLLVSHLTLFFSLFFLLSLSYWLSGESIMCPSLPKKSNYLCSRGLWTLVLSASTSHLLVL